MMKFLETFIRFLRRTQNYVLFFILGSVSIYVYFLIVSKYESAKTFNDFVKGIWDYQLQESNNIKVSTLIILISVIWWSTKISKFLAYKLINSILEKTKINNGAKIAFENLAYYSLLVLSVIIAFQIAKIPLTVFTIFGGALAIGVGFGSQNIIGNFIGGIILQMEQPVKVGDIIEIEGSTGVIENIGGRSTKVKFSNNNYMILPNSYLLDKKIVNWTFSDNTYRAKVFVMMGYDVKPTKVEEMIFEAVSLMDGIIKDRLPNVKITNFESYAISYEITFWLPIKTTSDKSEIESKFRVKFLETIEKHGIKYPVINIANIMQIKQ